jgi:hypothetical protein
VRPVTSWRCASQPAISTGITDAVAAADLGTGQRSRERTYSAHNSIRKGLRQSESGMSDVTRASISSNHCTKARGRRLQSNLNARSTEEVRHPTAAEP